MIEIEDRVNHLDELMAQLIQTVDQTSREMREFKTEMRLAHEQAEERSKREMQAFKDEMRQSHEQFEREMRQSKRDLYKKMGGNQQKIGNAGRGFSGS